MVSSRSRGLGTMYRPQDLSRFFECGYQQTHIALRAHPDFPFAVGLVAVFLPLAAAPPDDHSQAFGILDRGCSAGANPHSLLPRRNAIHPHVAPT